MGALLKKIRIEIDFFVKGSEGILSVIDRFHVTLRRMLFSVTTLLIPYPAA